MLFSWHLVNNDFFYAIQFTSGKQSNLSILTFFLSLAFQSILTKKLQIRTSRLTLALWCTIHRCTNNDSKWTKRNSLIETLIQYPPNFFIYIYSKTSIKINAATDESNSRNEIGHWANDEIGVAYKVGSGCELNSWPDSSVG